MSKTRRRIGTLIFVLEHGVVEMQFTLHLH